MPIEKSDIKSLTLDEEEQIREHIKEFSSFYDKINKRNSEAIWEAWEKSEALLKKQS